MNYPKLNECQIGFIGAGNIALSLTKGFINSGQISGKQVYASAPSDRNLIKFKELQCFTTNNTNELFSQPINQNNISTKIVFLCVKPHVFKDPNNSFNLSHLVSTYGPIIVISVMAGISIDKICSQLGFSDYSKEKIKFARLMPNTATSINSGICGISTKETDPQFHQFLRTLLSPIGLCEFVSEPQLNVVCGLGGSGIAFVYSLIHAMSDGGLKMGLPRNVSTNIAAQTVLGAALMVLKTQTNPIVLRDEVTSPAGTTIHGLHALERGAFHSVIMDAIECATKRANELS